MGSLRSFVRKATRDAFKRDEQKYLSEPVWVKMEAVMKKMKRMYAENPWIFADTAVMAVLESMRVDHERGEEEIDRLTEEEKVNAHNELEERLNRVHDKKKLEHQLNSMRLEYKKVTEMIKLHNLDKKQREGRIIP